MTDGPAYLTAPEAAKLLRCKTQRIHTWIRTGALRAANLSDGQRPTWRISRDDLDDFLAGRAARSIVPPKPRRRRKAEPEYIQFFAEK